MNFDRRIGKLERHSSLSEGRILFVVRDLTCPVNKDECIRLLDQRGKLEQSGCVLVNLMGQPDGLTDAEWAHARETA